jgi:hypothetical protein
MTSETKSLVDRYIDWLREKSSEEDLEGDWKLLTIPFLDRHNDALQVFVGPGHEGLRITDEGRIIRRLARITFTFGEASGYGKQYAPSRC